MKLIFPVDGDPSPCQTWILAHLRDNGPTRKADLLDASPYSRDLTTATWNRLLERGLIDLIGRTLSLPANSLKLPETPGKLPETPGKSLEPRARTGNALGSKNLTSEALGSSSSSIPSAIPKSETATWWVCCVWKDAAGALWCHGQDGYQTYIPCGTEAEAIRLAKRHVEMIHRGRKDHQGVFPRVDICRAHGRGKELHSSLGDLS